MSETPFGAAPVEEAAPVRRYAALRRDILVRAETLSGLEGFGGEALDELKRKVESETFNLVVVGQFKRGKTCFINALMGTEILPVAVVPLTSIVTILKYGDSVGAEVLFEDGRVADIGLGELPGYITETGNPRNVKKVREAMVTFPSEYLKGGVRLVDTPGVGSVYQHNTDIAYRYLPRSDAALFLLSVDQPVSQAELDFLRDVREYAHKIFFLLNKIDYVNAGEIDQAIGFSREVIREAMGAEVNIVPVSAKLALDGKGAGGEDALRRSNLPAFTSILEAFLAREKGKVLIVSAANGLLRMASHGRLEREIELRSLNTPGEELAEKIRAFGEKKEEILAQRENFDLLLGRDLEKIAGETLNRDIDAFRKDFLPLMQEEFDAFYEANKDLPLKEMNEALETHVAEKVEAAFSAWRDAEDAKLADAFREVCEHFVADMNEKVDELTRFSSELFAIPFEVTRAEAFWTEESGFFFKLRDEPVGLDMLATSLSNTLPRTIHSRFKKLKDAVTRAANRFIVGRRRQRMFEVIDMQAGRARYDFSERLKKSRDRFQADLKRRMDQTVNGIGSAIEKGMKLKAAGEREAEARRALLERELAALETLRQDLAAIRDEAAGL